LQELFFGKVSLGSATGKEANLSKTPKIGVFILE
jgi:hypothetical protein